MSDSNRYAPGGRDTSQSVRITSDGLKKLSVAKIFRDNKRTITSLDFDDTGEVCITAAEDESLQLYDCLEGRHLKTLYSKKYGVHLARFTHRKSNVIYASTKEDDTLRYLSLHDNKYIRYFRGHKDRVVSLEMSPVGDQFLSAAVNDTVRLWDLRSSTCQGLINVTGRPCIGFDPAGLIFAVAFDSSVIRLYDMKAYDKGPFITFSGPPNDAHQSSRAEWTSLRFSNDGKKILVTTSGDMHFVLDAFHGSFEKRLTGHVSVSAPNLGGNEACFTPDGRYVLSGSQDGGVHLWDLESKSQDTRSMHVFEAHTAPTGITGFNPKYMMMVTGCSELAFWEPKLSSKPGWSDSR
ncbi:uncharacterized protein VTP21DRAFT_2182 [Calcarisporiella thermophila]|uniref:uncharacterized protein n=1 Tax=Calcarisporiella thermophila TaxID=911321 RepID=UPI003743AD30